MHMVAADPFLLRGLALAAAQLCFRTATHRRTIAVSIIIN
jgi:hypothetical protein